MLETNRKPRKLPPNTNPSKSPKAIASDLAKLRLTLLVTAMVMVWFIAALFLTSTVATGTNRQHLHVGNLQDLVTFPKSKAIYNFRSQFHHRSSSSLLLQPQNLDQILDALASRSKISMHLTNRPKISANTAKTTVTRFSFENIPLCEVSLTRNQWADQPELVLGELPPSMDSLYAPSSWPDFYRTLELVAQTLDPDNAADSIKTLHSERCLVERLGQWYGVWDLLVERNGLTYSLRADEFEIFALEAKFFEVTGKATIFPQNSLDTEKKTFEIADMKSSGKLDSKDFFVTLDTNSDESLVSTTDSVFNFEHGTSAFDQTSIFTNASRTLSWYLAHGYKNFGTFPIRLVVHALINADANNALYNPSISGSSTIFIGDGDGTVLKNLATDADVVSHEFGHHVIFSSITSTEGESLVLHEGIADFFTFASTGNACLGESICPANSPIRCAVDKQCLRSGDNQLKYTDSSLPKEAHLRSQLVSGMLWDLHKKDSLPIETLAKAMLNAIDLMGATSGYHDLVLALVQSDFTLNAGANCNTIYNRAVERGFAAVISDFNCTGTLPSIDRSSGGSGGGSSGGSARKDSGGSGLCGVISTNHQGGKTGLLLLPLALLGLSRIRFHTT